MCVCACLYVCVRSCVCDCVCVCLCVCVGVNQCELGVFLFACVRKATRKYIVWCVYTSSPSRNLSRARTFSISLKEGETRFQGYRKILSRFTFCVIQVWNLRYQIRYKSWLPGVSFIFSTLIGGCEKAHTLLSLSLSLSRTPAHPHTNINTAVSLRYKQK